MIGKHPDDSENFSEPDDNQGLAAHQGVVRLYSKCLSSEVQSPQLIIELPFREGASVYDVDNKRQSSMHLVKSSIQQG